MMEGMKRALDTRKVDMRALKVASSTILTARDHGRHLLLLCAEWGRIRFVERCARPHARFRLRRGIRRHATRATSAAHRPDVLAHTQDRACDGIRLSCHIARHHVLADCGMETRNKGRSEALPTTRSLCGHDGVRHCCALCVQRRNPPALHRRTSGKSLTCSSTPRGAAIGCLLMCLLMWPGHDWMHEAARRSNSRIIRKACDVSFRSPLSRLRSRLLRVCPPVVPRRG